VNGKPRRAIDRDVRRIGANRFFHSACSFERKSDESSFGGVPRQAQARYLAGPVPRTDRWIAGVRLYPELPAFKIGVPTGTPT